MNTELSVPAAPVPRGGAETETTETQTEESRSAFRFDQRLIAPVFITLILIVGHFSFGILESYTKTALAIATAILVDLILARLFKGSWPHLSSAYISGISVGILVRSPAIWPYALCSALAITSKYVLRVKGRHIWNPSNFGICAMLFLAHETVASLSVQWGNNIWPMLTIWVLGSVIIYRLRHFHITFTYVASFIIFAFVRSWITGHTWQAEIAPITGPMYQLFIFFMITDPKTTVRSKAGQIAVAFTVALAETILRLAESVHAPYYALFIVGPTANLIEIYLTSRRQAHNKMTDLTSPTAT
jgi:Na+-translocating ferredoxin:NAD+ oxidoreductase RnfD subunit